jgi:hypothetical protein
MELARAIISLLERFSPEAMESVQNHPPLWDLFLRYLPPSPRRTTLFTGRIYSLAGRPPLKVIPKHWPSIETLNWVADGTRLFVASRTQQSSVLLSIDMQSNVQVVWERKGTLGNEVAGMSGISSPDGRRLAMMGFTGSGNMWRMDGY